ncbi:transcriptional regulator, AlpA family [Luteibacter sp. UNC138MFCol5.1]|uniref:helix-turn-helix transcriptional regulator n=1 Tax=Luteibacter sp. UNC138MFCol5.1 TaxID=1502774 RepID=UPI0008D47761|nr:AlpA family transcriptional regulator [Luteibacter sp. UNC138MFCol5.1]SEO74236.1 transcriptional regulator, AlpA family [Luteibacter sp. UNC138MFCol5.1]
MQTSASPIRFIRLPDVLKQTGLSRSYVYKLESKGQFPRRVKLGVLASAWIESEVQNWCADRVEATRGAA